MIIALQPNSDAKLIGGKGQGLVRLMTAGLPVPEAWCITADTSLDAVARDNCVDTELADWWTEVDDPFPAAPWAVRSSAVAEDLADASFAGVYETVLGVTSSTGCVKRFDSAGNPWTACAPTAIETSAASRAWAASR